jgi:hypothetical protein
MQTKVNFWIFKFTVELSTFQSLTNWFTGIFLILLGLYHNLAAGPLIGEWLQSLQAQQMATFNPLLTNNDVSMGRLGFEMGGYLAIAIGLSFMLLGRSLPRGYYLLWAIFFLIFGGLSLFTFQSFHESQLVWLLTILLGTYYFLVLVTVSNATSSTHHR